MFEASQRVFVALESILQRSRLAKCRFEAKGGIRGAQ